MPPPYIHIFGASGSGTTTLGVHLARTLSVAHFDADDYYWRRTKPPYTVKTPVEERVLALTADMRAAGGWVLSGSVVGWGDIFVPSFSLAVFVSLPHQLRMERLQLRETERYGDRITVGGDMYEASRAFMAWASEYDDPGVSVRSRERHERWLRQLPCPVLRVQSTEQPAYLAREVLRHVEVGP